MRQRRGVALIVVLIIAVVLLATLTAGFKLGSDGVLMVSQTHKRNVALAAAEAGVYQAMLRLDEDKAFEGEESGTLSDSGATFQMDVTNDLSGSQKAEVVSTGTYGGVSRTLKASLVPDASNYQAVSIAGKIYVFDRAYVNGIASAENPLLRPGHVHTEFSTPSDYAYVAEYYDNYGGQPTKMYATGDITATGNFDPGLVTTSDSKSSGVSKNPYKLDKSGMGSPGPVLNASTLNAGTLTGNRRVTDPDGDPIVVNGKVVVPKGMTLYVNGDVDFLGGLGGEGNVVVSGDVIIRTNSSFDPAVKEGVKLYSDGAVAIGHPSTEVNSDGVDVDFSPVGDFFAQMPDEASYEISNGIPTDAPSGTEFFTWFAARASLSNPGEQYELWYNGDGSALHPGLSPATKSWLQQSRASNVQSWAAAN